MQPSQHLYGLARVAAPTCGPLRDRIQVHARSSGSLRPLRAPTVPVGHPHNGHSNSFSTLLELLDPHRFTRGVKVLGRSDLDPVMVRQLKDDIRRAVGGFPVRHVEPVIIDGLPKDAPELVLSRLLDEYRGLRDRRFAHATPWGRAAAGPLVVGVQQRLLSSIEAFAISLAKHRKTVERHWQDRSRISPAGHRSRQGAGGWVPEGARSHRRSRRRGTLRERPG